MGSHRVWSLPVVLLASVVMAQDDPLAKHRIEQKALPKYVPYAGNDVRKLFRAEEAEDDGGVEMTLFPRKIEAVLGQLERHARSYPPRFRDEKKERPLAVRDARAMSRLFEAVLNKPKTDVELLVQAGRLEAVGHNLELEGSSKRAIAYFERALKKDPKHKQGHLCFGMFLAGTATLQKRAIPILEKAAKLGEPMAYRGLGMVFIMRKQREKGLANLRLYSKAFPKDEQTRRMIKILESGAKIERKDKQ